MVAKALHGDDGVPLAALDRLASALDMELVLVRSGPPLHLVGFIPTVVDQTVVRLSPERAVYAANAVPNVLALDLEGALISNAVSVFPRPGLFRFLICCRPLFERIVVFTTVTESRFRQIAATLAEEGFAPAWFTSIEYIPWSGPTKDLRFVPDTDVDHVLLVDDLELYVHPDQRTQWIPIGGFEPPFVEDDGELDRVLEQLARRVLWLDRQ